MYYYLCSKPCTAEEAEVIVRAAKNAETDPMMVLFTDDFLRSTSVFSFPFSFFWNCSDVILPLVVVFLFFLVKFRKIPRPFVKKYGITLTFLSFSITNIVAFSSILLLQGKSIAVSTQTKTFHETIFTNYEFLASLVDRLSN